MQNIHVIIPLVTCLRAVMILLMPLGFNTVICQSRLYLQMAYVNLIATRIVVSTMWSNILAGINSCVSYES